MNISLITGLMLSSALFSCNSTSEGPCGYTDPMFVKMEITSIEPSDEEGIYNVWLQFDQSILAQEKQELGDLRNVKITSDYLTKNHLQEGITLTGKVSELTEGDCEPYVLSWNHGFTD
ncbi:hypothetical protein [Salibacter halophilus]|uniref:Uncharacterized protein n=1 Tax=Salibacter halophilus TaxID=1803916 RepID=A0A6N6ME79_9FLAO|nr:hypothetical protein [Salibacter halophilus]KAB1066015.1 hypothetical protein F3059_00665 [Salibacter halophilus]